MPKLKTSELLTPTPSTRSCALTFALVQMALETRTKNFGALLIPKFCEGMPAQLTEDRLLPRKARRTKHKALRHQSFLSPGSKTALTPLGAIATPRLSKPKMNKQTHLKRPPAKSKSTPSSKEA